MRPRRIPPTPSPEVPLISDKPLLEARHSHEPDVVAAAGRSSLIQWAQRALRQSDIASARELAGLTDAELTHLENEFSRFPKRPRPAWQRDAMPLGIALLLLAGCAFAAPEYLASLSAFDTQLVRVAGAALLMIGVLALSSGYLASFTGTPLDRAYGTLGLYVSQLARPPPLAIRDAQCRPPRGGRRVPAQGAQRARTAARRRLRAHVRDRSRSRSARSRAPGELGGRGAAAPARPFAAVRRRRRFRATFGADHLVAWSGLGAVRDLRGARRRSRLLARTARLVAGRALNQAAGGEARRSPA